MDWNRVEGNWKQIKGKVKEQWGKLTDDDLDTIDGKQDQLEVSSSSVTVTKRIKPKKSSTTGLVARSGSSLKPADTSGLSFV
ncbi:hypothetical protein ABIA40_000903 [Bradyrhizobium sp. USDA 223]